MIRINKIIFKIFLVGLTFGLINAIIPNSFSFFSKAIPLENAILETDNPVLIEAIENVKLYSVYNYQTLTDAKLEQLSTDFFLPIAYSDVDISWKIDSSRISLTSTTEYITIQSISGEVEIEVIYAHIESFPTALQGNETFYITATMTYGSNEATKVFVGSLSPVIPSDFFGGAFFTFVRYFSLFLEGVTTTLGLSLAGTVIGFIIALGLVFMRLDQKNIRTTKLSKILKRMMISFSKFYVTIFRGTPMIVQAAFFWYGLGLFGDAMLCGLFVVSVNTAAYIAEILRGGIGSVDSGQAEAARSLGMTNFQSMRYVIFPQAIKNSMPAIGNEFVINIKDTSVLSIIGIFELFNQTRKIAGMHYRQLEAYFVVGLIYLFLTYSVTKGLQAIEKKLDMPVKELTSSN
ncbi:MAG: amino acid ABC transporter permease [Candidatus Izemoplasmatales bacterium]|jgi:putative lysine transport system permease protein|nr:amino acid ABC transporter permease [Candidatus Izemoplasmatales bacterium]